MKKVKVEKGVSDNAPSSEAAVTTGSAVSQRVDCARSRLNPTKKINDFGFAKVKNSGLYKSVKKSKSEENQMSNSKEDLLELNSSSEDKSSSSEPS